MQNPACTQVNWNWLKKRHPCRLHCHACNDRLNLLIMSQCDKGTWTGELHHQLHIIVPVEQTVPVLALPRVKMQSATCSESVVFCTCSHLKALSYRLGRVGPTYITLYAKMLSGGKITGPAENVRRTGIYLQRTSPNRTHLTNKQDIKRT